MPILSEWRPVGFTYKRTPQLIRVAVAISTMCRDNLLEFVSLLATKDYRPHPFPKSIGSRQMIQNSLSIESNSPWVHWSSPNFVLSKIYAIIRTRCAVVNNQGDASQREITLYIALNDLLEHFTTHSNSAQKLFFPVIKGKIAFLEPYKSCR